jgi:hypothetical protein
MQVPEVVIPAQTIDTGYEIVTVPINANPVQQLTTITVAAPTGKKFLGAPGIVFTPNSGFSGNSNSYPNADGTVWTIEASISKYGSNPCGTVYAICLSI